MQETDRIWFTSDTHFGHKFMVERRGFDTVEEHDDHIIETWNQKVGIQDIIFHLGDFSFSHKQKTKGILRKLHGRIHLVRGNHDRMGSNVEAMLSWVGNYRQIKPTVRGATQPIMLFHFPIQVWDKCHYGSWHLHGHSHGNLPQDPTKRRIDVSWDVWGAPVDLEGIANTMSYLGFKAEDHHTEKE